MSKILLNVTPVATTLEPSVPYAKLFLKPEGATHINSKGVLCSLQLWKKGFICDISEKPSMLSYCVLQTRRTEENHTEGCTGDVKSEIIWLKAARN